MSESDKVKNYVEWDDLVKICIAITVVNIGTIFLVNLCDSTATKKISELNERIVVLETKAIFDRSAIPGEVLSER